MGSAESVRSSVEAPWGLVPSSWRSVHRTPPLVLHPLLSRLLVGRDDIVDRDVRLVYLDDPGLLPGVDAVDVSVRASRGEHNSVDFETTLLEGLGTLGFDPQQFVVLVLDSPNCYRMTGPEVMAPPLAQSSGSFTGDEVERSRK